MLSEVFSLRAIRPVDLRSRQKEFLDMACGGEILFVARPAKKSVVVMSEAEFNRREKALKNMEYLAMLDNSLEEVRNGEAFEYLGGGKFGDAPVKVNI